MRETVCRANRGRQLEMDWTIRALLVWLCRGWSVHCWLAPDCQHSIITHPIQNLPRVVVRWSEHRAPRQFGSTETATRSRCHHYTIVRVPTSPPRSLGETTTRGNSSREMPEPMSAFEGKPDMMHSRSTLIISYGRRPVKAVRALSVVCCCLITHRCIAVGAAQS